MMPALPGGLCAVSSSTFQVGKCARGPGCEPRGGSHVRSPSPEGWVPLPLRASGPGHSPWPGRVVPTLPASPSPGPH